MTKRREPEEFSMSFLDVICCGFGAIILLLMITKTAEPVVLEKSVVDLGGQVVAKKESLFEIRGQVKELQRQKDETQDALDNLLADIATKKDEESKILGQFATTTDQADQANAGLDQLAAAKQKLTEEMERLLGLGFKRSSSTIGGIPVDSEYIIFIIDTSGSMFSYSWDRMLAELEATLSIYPEVKGIQVMNDMGNYLFSRYRGQWIPDTAGRRNVILQNLRNWNVFSNSSPVEGITQAIRTFYDPGKKISIYVFGDEFTGDSIAQVVDTVDRINREDAEGNRRVRIHGVGFPVQFIRAPHLQTTGIRFATLMRELAFRNGGTFVGLNDFRP